MDLAWRTRIMPRPSRGTYEPGEDEPFDWDAYAEEVALGGDQQAVGQGQ